MEIEAPQSTHPVAPALPEETGLLALMNLQNYAQANEQVVRQNADVNLEQAYADSHLKQEDDVDKMNVESLQFPAILSQLGDPVLLQQQMQQQLLQQQMQQQQLQTLQQQQYHQQLLQQQLQQQQQPMPQPTIPPTVVPLNTDSVNTANSEPITAPNVPPPEFHQIVYAITPPIYVYPSMFSSFMYPMMLPDSGFSMGYSASPGSPGGIYQGSIPMKIKKSPSNKDSSKKKQTRKTLWIPLTGTDSGCLF